MGQFGSKFKPLDAFDRATLFFRDRVQVSLARDLRRGLGELIEERMSRADLYEDLPPGKKRRGWKKEFLESLTEAAKDIGEVSEEEILRTVRSYRKQRRVREITVAAEG